MSWSISDSLAQIQQPDLNPRRPPSGRHQHNSTSSRLRDRVVFDPTGTPKARQIPDYDHNRSDPGPVSDPGPPPRAKSLPRTRRKTAAKEAADVFTITATSDTASLSAGRVRRGRAPLASASKYLPCGARTRCWLSVRCPWCGGVHLHRLADGGDGGGRRRTGCGRVVFVKIRQTYGSASRQVAA
jgi:hypothetical protein